MDNHPFRVIGVLRKDFWFLGERPAVWSLFDETMWRSFPIAMTGAICRLRPLSPSVAEHELRRLAREMVPRESGTGVTVDPLDVIVSRPIRYLGPLSLAFNGLALLSALACLAVRGDVVPGAFLLAKTVFLLSAIFLAGFEFGGVASVTGIGGTTVAAGTAFWWLIAAGSLSPLVLE